MPFTPLLFLAFLAATAFAESEPVDADPSTRPPALAVYLPDYRAKDAASPNFYGTTDLILFSAEPKDDGTVDFSRITPALLAIGKKAKSESGIAVSVCVGGWARGVSFAKAVSTEETRNRFIDGLHTFCSKHELDGVDIDWEFPKGDRERADFALFLEALSTKLRADGRKLTIALGYTRPLPPECWKHIDRVHLMSYQPWNDEPYEPWLEASVKRFLDTGLPPEKLLVGVGFFAKEKAGERRSVMWKDLKGKPEAHLPKSEHGFWPIGRQSNSLRTRLMKKHGLGGIMIWEFGQDSPDPEQSLLRHLSAEMGLLRDAH